MKQNKNLESDRIIAEFMGWKLDMYGKPFLNGKCISSEEYYEFSSSWNWLMPVFKKYCEEVEKVMPNPTSRTRISFCVDFIAGVWANNIDVSYKYLVSGIIWYNDRIKKQ